MENTNVIKCKVQNFDKELEMFIAYLKSHRSLQIDIILKWIEKAFIKHEIIKINYMKNMNKEGVMLLARRLADYNYAVIDDNDRMMLLPSIFNLRYYEIYESKSNLKHALDRIYENRRVKYFVCKNSG